MLTPIHTIHCLHRGAVTSALCSLCWSRQNHSFRRVNGIEARTRCECVEESAIGAGQAAGVVKDK